MIEYLKLFLLGWDRHDEFANSLLGIESQCSAGMTNQIKSAKLYVQRVKLS